jgi:large subunit ribosomal protein L17
MRHRRRTHRFGRNPKERQAMLENLVTSLLTHQQITTTLEKAKETKKLADRVITLGKADSLHSRRQAFSYLQDHALTSKLFKEVAPRFKTRAGGYTRILQLSRRKGDGAQMALLELTEKEIKVKEAKPKKAKEHKHEHGHGHDHEHKHEAKPDAPKGKTPAGKPERAGEPPAKGGSASGGKKGGFFRNISKFFRNKGGG